MKIILLIITIIISCGEEESAVVQSLSPDFSKLNSSCYSANSNNPIISSGDLFSGSTWNDPSVLYENNQYIMYASSYVSFHGDIKIYRLVSNDGNAWSLSPSTAVLEKGSSSAWDDKAVETPTVVNFNGTYHMFYTGYQTNTATEFAIGHATSSDGINWTKSGANPLVTSIGGVATADDFDQFITAEPGAVVFNGQIYVYFTGQGYITTSGGTTINDQLMTIELIKSSNGSTFSSPERVFDPDQTLYPRSGNWKGHSTPQPIVMNNQLHLYVDVFYTDGSDSQRKIHHAFSSDGENNWTNDTSDIFERSDFSWTADEIRSPSAVLVGTTLKLFFASNAGTDLGIGVANCEL